MTSENYFWICPSCKATISGSSPDALEIGIFEHQKTHGAIADRVFKKSSFTVYSVEEVADILKVSLHVVRAQIKRGKLHAKRIGKEYRILKEDLLDFMDLEEL